jgi:acyl carrier protein
MSDIEAMVRQALGETGVHAGQKFRRFVLTDDLRYGYGLTSLDLIMLLSALCEQAGIDLAKLDEDDIGGLHTPADIVNLLSTKVSA